MTDLICAVVFLIGLAGAVYCVRRGIRVWRGDDYRTRNDQVAAQAILRTDPPAEQQTPGTDSALLLDCIAVFGDCEELDRLRNAIHQHRKENPQP
ncbi:MULTISPECIES: hypothetical protein [Streptomyces]|uniref:Uncharacterized protein n=1 Tax=Streptomyces dengpaensis TaxID=2049881 RepID=A0ABN5I9S3_9ACTN|nr:MULTISPECIES: hypothetical protein [Streptomyces]AVH59930.1 hypothetical protein C4B68_33815 [Streptomyces dengpaensis]PIB09565.1 hypothetical protein B1C81_10490 [Streptomyces sp. HG99]